MCQSQSLTSCIIISYKDSATLTLLHRSTCSVTLRHNTLLFDIGLLPVNPSLPVFLLSLQFCLPCPSSCLQPSPCWPCLSALVPHLAQLHSRLHPASSSVLHAHRLALSSVSSHIHQPKSPEIKFRLISNSSVLPLCVSHHFTSSTLLLSISISIARLTMSKFSQLIVNSVFL